ncbi:IPT/TIG domain-containing protein, partial [Candidatus Magnetomorum sp. HK-1]
MGKIQAIALNNRMIYAGASFFHVNEQSAENPINETDIPIQLSGSLNTFMDKERMVSPIVDYIHTIVLSNESIIASNATTIKVSDSGGTEIIVTGTGFNGNIRAYWFKIFLNGIPDYHQLQVNFINTTTFSVISPICQHGQSYQLMIQKTETQENVQSHTLLHGIDDTAPKILSEQPLSYLTPLKLVFSEPVTVDQFSVISEFMTYTGSETTDVSHWFDLFVNENALTLHLKTHMALKHNRAYHIQINGINDLYGNIPVNWETITGGNYASFISGKDTLPPSQLSLIRQLDGQIVNLGMQLTRNKTYTFIPSAIDNMTSANDLAYHIRISRDGGLTFGDFQIILNQGFNVFIEGTDTKIVFLLKVTDKAGYVAENRFEAAVCQENILISSLYTAPHPSEERSNVHICFDLTGDIDLIFQAELQIAEQPYALAQVTQQDSQQIFVCNHWINPAYDVFPNNEIPVRLKLTIGQSDHKFIDDSYFIQKDSTPPIVYIVSPPDGAGIPVGQPTIIVVQAFDTCELNDIRIRVNHENWILLENTHLFTYTPTNTDSLTIEASATDTNGNTSVISDDTTITLFPFTGLENTPVLNILSPENGTVYHEKENILLALEMKHLTQAVLYMDIGGSKEHADNPQALTVVRSVDDFEQIAVNIQLPAVEQDMMVILRVESHKNSDRCFLSVTNDPGVLLIGVGENIYLLETEKEFPQVPRLLITANYPVTALDMDNQTIIAGLGSHGIAVFETSLLSVNASSSMDFSGQSMIFSSTDDLPLKLNIPEGINAVNYLLDDTVIAKTTTPPFSFNAPVPATLHNGQTFHIQAIIETHSGEIFTSKAYTANVYTQSLPENTIEISLIINNDYLPLPVNIHSAVTSTIYPISHIE